jgi:hypothetical protein
MKFGLPFSQYVTGIFLISAALSRFSEETFNNPS